MNCPKCDKEVDDGSLFCSFCGESFEKKEEKKIDDGLSDEAVKEEVVKVKRSFDKKKGIILAIVAIIAVVGIGFGIKSYMDTKAREEYVVKYNQYVDDIESLKMQMLSGGASAEKVCNLTLSVWSNAIWKTSDSKTDKYTKPNGTFVSDFNDALLNLTKDQTVMKDRVSLSASIDTVIEKIETMKNPPEDLKDKYEVLKEMVDKYQEFLNLAITPTGSYKSYNSEISQLDSAFMRLYRKVDAFNLKHITE